MLSSQSIDWTGHLLGASTLVSKPLPVIAKNSKDYFLLITAANQLKRALKPATPKEILYALTKLRLHYATNVMSEHETAILLEDYLNDLSPYPRDILEQACIDYRKGGKHLFFPKIGQLISLMSKYWNLRQLKFQRITKLLEVSQLNNN